MDDLVLFRDVSKEYSGSLALRAASFGIRPGSITLIAGPNGSGKTTLLRILLGFCSPTTGTVTYSRQLGDATQRFVASFDQLWAPGDVGGSFYWECIRQNTGASREKSDEILRAVDISPVTLKKKIAKMSLGTQKRYSLGLALLSDAEMIVLDEPLNGLDPAGILWMRRLLVDLKAKGKTIVIASHLLNESALVADNICLLRNEMLYFGGLDNLIAETGTDTLEEAYFEYAMRE